MRLPVATTVAALLAATPAAATTIDVHDGMLDVAGDAGHNSIAIYAAAGNAAGGLSVRDVFEHVTTNDAACSRETDTIVTCPSAGVQRVTVHLGDGNDQLQFDAPLPVNAYGDDGDDWLATWAAEPAVLDGGAGDDRIVGGPGDDTLIGGPGHDEIGDASGNDTVDAADGEQDDADCGPGTDTGTFDVFDIEMRCESGVLPPAPPPDCTPEAQPLTRASVRRLLNAGNIRLAAAVDPPCILHAQLAAGGRALANAASAAGQTSVRLTLSRRARHRLRTASRLTLTLVGSAAGATTITRVLPVPTIHS